MSFYQVRVAALHDQIAAEVTELSLDGRTPTQQLAEISVRVQEFVAKQERLLMSELLPTLSSERRQDREVGKVGQEGSRSTHYRLREQNFPHPDPSGWSIRRIRFRTFPIWHSTWR